MSERIPVYRHDATNPHRFYYDTNIKNDSGWSEGTFAFFAYTTQEPGTIPIYLHYASNPDRYFYDTEIDNNYGWSKGVVAFYAYAAQEPGTVPIYRHDASDPHRFYYDTNINNNYGWSQGVVAFYAYPPGWMASVGDNALLSQISLPGTHDAMSRYGYYSECQTWTLMEQLTNGIRVFDIRLCYEQGANGEVNFSIYHSGDYQFAFLDSRFSHRSDAKYFVLDDCLEFLRLNPTECIVLEISQEKDKQDRTAFYDAFWKIVDARITLGNGIDPNQKLFYQDNTVPRLIDARGRIIFAFCDDKEGSDPQRLDSPRWGLYWGNILYQVQWDHREPWQQPLLDVENHWGDNMGAKWDKVTAHLDKAVQMGPGAVIWFITFVSASQVPLVGHWPVQYAAYLLPKLQDYIQQNVAKVPGTWPWGAYFGTVMMDFPTKEIIGQLVSTSLKYQYP